MINITQELRSRLASFGHDDSSKKAIHDATEANGWFTREDICRSVEAICNQMLCADKLNEWMSHYPTLPCEKSCRVAIIMAGNIPLVGFFDLLCTLMAGHQAWIKPSSKDRVLMEYICELLREIDKDIPIYIYDDTKQYDAIIATGGDEANRYFESRFASTRRLCRGNRHSIAVLSDAQSEQEMQLLAEDIYSYSGLGCRNVAMIFSPRGSKIDIPTLTTSPKYHNSYLQTKALLTMMATPFEDNGASVITRSAQFPRSLSSISIWEYDSIEQVEEWIEQHDNTLQCIVSQIIRHPRCVNFGEAQHPTLHDYADGVDTMQFLCNI